MKMTVSADEYHAAARAYLGQLWFHDASALFDVHIAVSENGDIVFDVTRDARGKPKAKSGGGNE